MERVKLGIIGCGRITQGCHLPAIAETDSVELVAACDANEELATNVISSHGAKWACDNVEQLCQSEDVEAVVICLPHHLHAQAVLTAARGGKHILVEKPFANTTAECDEMINAAGQSGVVLMVGHVMRFSAEFQQLKSVIDRGDVGVPVSIRARRLTSHKTADADWWKSREKCGGLVIPLNGSHIFDTIFWIFNSSPVRVFAVGQTIQRDIWEGEDEADIIIEMDNGTKAIVSLSFNSSHRVNDILIVGDKDCLYSAEQDLQVEKETGKANEEFVLQMQEFADSIIEDRSPAVNGRQARKVVQTIEAANLSIETGKVVEL